MGREPNEQESDRLERMPKGDVTSLDAAVGHVRLVSLGGMCASKLSFQKLGRGAETLPFDWIRTRIEGVMHFLQNDFQGFFDFQTGPMQMADVPGDGMTVYRSYYHSFWHDDPRDARMRERYARRLARWKEIDAREDPVLFVRACAETSELAKLPRLLEALRQGHGRHAKLLFVMSFQDPEKHTGPSFVRGFDNLILYYLEPDANCDGYAPFCKPIKVALDWVVGRPMEAVTFDSLGAAEGLATKYGLGKTKGELSFEDFPPNCQGQGAVAQSPHAMPFR